MEITQIEVLKKRLYGLYQLDWMQQHGWTITDIFSSLQELIIEDSMADSLEDMFSIALRFFQEDYGFKGTSEIYDSEEEFFSKNGLYNEKEYIHCLCSGIDGGMKLYEDYSNSLKDVQKEIY